MRPELRCCSTFSISKLLFIEKPRFKLAQKITFPLFSWRLLSCLSYEKPPTLLVSGQLPLEKLWGIPSRSEKRLRNISVPAVSFANFPVWVSLKYPSFCAENAFRGFSDPTYLFGCDLFLLLELLISSFSLFQINNGLGVLIDHSNMVCLNRLLLLVLTLRNENFIV